MIGIIRGHNRLNGLSFSVVEFGFVAVTMALLAGYFLILGSFLLGLIALGIATNCSPVILLGLASLRAGESDLGLRAMLRPATRARALREHPTMQRDTYLLAGATLLPFVVAVAACVQFVAWRRNRY